MARKSDPLKLIFAVGKATYKAGLAASREADKRAKANSAAQNRAFREQERINNSNRKAQEREQSRLHAEIERKGRLAAKEQEQNAKLVAKINEQKAREQEKIDKQFDFGATSFDDKVRNRILKSSLLRAVLYVKDTQNCSLIDAITTTQQLTQNP
ncbi:hypothetical protein LX69_01099 [Breznakibacter xylanolyticus]|uniref:Uncharacterized protein n=1 Tax=Breznakibacter xylanolyticus TaxID=990 RepID=A0A2W7NEZ7_9BACT|nr:hypothetical protein [Breznakibacter xylanolyticus]PZX18063.1 hypothetical protein LX69_01099 [Breznakibacter xylanolyticus]